MPMTTARIRRDRRSTASNISSSTAPIGWGSETVGTDAGRPAA